MGIAAIRLPPSIAPRAALGSWRERLEAGVCRLLASIRVPVKPAWARVPDRAWRRHGALIACLHEQRRARGP